MGTFFSAPLKLSPAKEELALRLIAFPALLARLRLGFCLVRRVVVVLVVTTLALFLFFAIVDPFFEAALRTVVVFLAFTRRRVGFFAGLRFRVVFARRFVVLRRAFNNRIWLIR